eukprot:5566504-Amphidinium_carterae.1
MVYPAGVPLIRKARVTEVQVLADIECTPSRAKQPSRLESRKHSLGSKWGVSRWVPVHLQVLQFVVCATHAVIVFVNGNLPRLAALSARQWAMR